MVKWGGHVAGDVTEVAHGVPHVVPNGVPVAARPAVAGTAPRDRPANGGVSPLHLPYRVPQFWRAIASPLGRQGRAKIAPAERGRAGLTCERDV